LIGGEGNEKIIVNKTAKENKNFLFVPKGENSYIYVLGSKKVVPIY